MPEARAAWGIDIGQSALKALKLRYFPEAGQVVAVAFDYVPYPKILSQPDAIPEEIVPQAMQTFLSRNEVKDDLVAISVPGQSALARFIQLPPVEVSKLAEIVKYEARQQIPFSLEEVIWDFQPLGAGAEESGYLLDAEVGLFAMKREQVMQALWPFNDAKLEVELIQIAPLGIHNVLCYDELGIRVDKEGDGSEEYIIALDMGCDNTTLLVSNGKKIWIRNVPLGGNHFTRALTKEMKLSFAKAEHLKCNATKSPDPRAVFQALRPIFNDYVSEIQRSVGYFSSVNRQAKITKVLGYGNGFKLAGLQKFLQQNLQYEVERPDTFKGLAGDSVLNAPLFSDNLLSFAVPYGLALQTLGLTRIRTTLLPPEIATLRKVRRKKPWAVAAAAALLLGFSLSTFGNAFSFAKPNSAGFADAEKQAQDLGGEVTKYRSDYDAQKGKFTKTKTDLMKLVEGRRQLYWLDVYNAVIDCLPRDEGNQGDETDIKKRQMMSLTSFTAEKKGDVGEWFTKLAEEPKQWMTSTDKQTAPSGEGYVFTLQGVHWHTGDNAQDKGLAYIVHTFLKNLQQPTIQRVDCPLRDVGRLGISHATVINYSPGKISYDPLGESKNLKLSAAAAGRVGAGLGGISSFGAQPFGPPVGSVPFAPPMVGGPGVPGRPGETSADGAEIIDETRFTVQFVLKSGLENPEKRPSISTGAETQAAEVAQPAAADPAQPPAAQPAKL